MPPPSGMLLAGEVGKPHGLAGEVFVVRISDDPHRFEAGSRLHRADGTVLTIATARPHSARFLVRFEGVDTREAAESLRGPLYVPGTETRDLDDDEFWHADLVGCSVTVGGAEVGTVTGVVTGSVQDLLEIDTPRGPRLIPMVKEIVTGVDTTARTVHLDPPEGLLD